MQEKTLEEELLELSRATQQEPLEVKVQFYEPIASTL